MNKERLEARAPRSAARRIYLHAARNELQVLLARSEAHRAGKDGPK